ncbi:hypothetical protein TNCV_916161 [Trichonephila clavipes]|nr:hypothetical protein TNCV_916161 [Trichonephila clavipes]
MPKILCRIPSMARMPMVHHPCNRALPCINIFVKPWKREREFGFIDTAIPRLMRTRSYAIFKSPRRIIFCLIGGCEGMVKQEKLGVVIQEVVDLERQINKEVDYDDVFTNCWIPTVKS